VPRRPKVPHSVRVEVLVANRHTCCRCRREKAVQLHHIDNNPRNNSSDNLAVLCLDCHSRVTGTEGLGTRFSPEEVAAYK